jgi:hypothetical protein
MDDLNASGAIAIWPDFDHVVPDWASLVELGFVGIRERARDYRRAHEGKGELTEKQKAFFDGIEIEYTAIIGFIDRLYRYALTKNHKKAERVAACLKQLRDGAPTNIYEAMQLIFLYFMVSESVDHYQVRSLGNGLDRLNDVMDRTDAEYRINLGKFVDDLFAVALGKAAGNDDGFELRVLFEPGNIENVVDRFLLCAFDKGTGVDDNDVSLGFLRGDLIARLQHLVQHNLGVHLVFRATEGYKSNLHFIVFLSRINVNIKIQVNYITMKEKCQEKQDVLGGFFVEGETICGEGKFLKEFSLPL